MLGISGNINFNIGNNKFVNFRNNPELFAIFIIPNHNAITGNIFNVKSNANLPTDNISIFILSILPVNKENIIPTTINIIHNVLTIFL